MVRWAVCNEAKVFSELILNNINSSILVTDAELKILYANPAAESFFKLSARRLKELSFEQLFRYSSFDLERVQQAIPTNQGFTDTEVSLVTIDENHAMAEMSFTPVKSHKETHLLIEVHPIDQIKRVSQESFVQSQMLASRDLIRGLAHEIKNPLGGIRGAAQLLDKMLSDNELKECTQIIMDQSDRLRNLVDRLLGPNRLPKRSQTNIHKILEQIRQLIELESDTDVVKFYRDYDPSIPEFVVDEEQIHQALLNIVRNAYQALHSQGQGKITFQTRIASKETIHGQRHKLAAIIKIIDNGPGIPEHIRDTLFYPMITTKSDGTGLGLSIAQTLINQHRGRIHCESWPGHTEFTVYLPIEL
ncbi:nitrogen regulation protein NR(II) [Catenovulum agarivorans DS-2]|uniref:Sensory histidine kinase/phosphatase NtrB n=1 Tax=Catenovulum agarivorans DS-2 TaxID=1328313 RepID=W7R2A6_9ALTE|nr:nitrogen regulation protein NR(II) [Catenovulum agarivorans]EWH11765.1 nitrogen regulation protein NR(II) [Catenovulum agarivorans DS-2]